MTRGSDESGATVVEYALLVGLCVLALVVGIEAVGVGLTDLFNGMQSDIDTWDD